MPNMLKKIQGAFLGCAIGDALGRPFESSLFSDPRLAPLVEARAKRQEIWAYSDDTQMMLSVAESMIQMATVEPSHLAQALAKSYDPARGYGKGMKLVFQALERGLSWQEAASSSWAEGSKGNGAAVRVAPIACRYPHDRARRREAARLSALISHTHPIALAGCALQASALAYLLACKDAESFAPLRFLESLAEEFDREPLFASKLRLISSMYQNGANKAEAVKALGNSACADESVPLALFAVVRWAPDVEAIIINTIQCGGDTDSIAALSGALIGALAGREHIPARWVENLERGPRGREYILRLAEALGALE